MVKTAGFFGHCNYVFGGIGQCNYVFEGRVAW
jgi:hypothetical protein